MLQSAHNILQMIRQQQKDDRELNVENHIIFKQCTSIQYQTQQQLNADQQSSNDRRKEYLHCNDDEQEFYINQGQQENYGELLMLIEKGVNWDNEQNDSEQGSNETNALTEQQSMDVANSNMDRKGISVQDEREMGQSYSRQETSERNFGQYQFQQEIIRVQLNHRNQQSVPQGHHGQPYTRSKQFRRQPAKLLSQTLNQFISTVKNQHNINQNNKNPNKYNLFAVVTKRVNNFANWIIIFIVMRLRVLMMVNQLIYERIYRKIILRKLQSRRLDIQQHLTEQPAETRIFYFFLLSMTSKMAKIIQNNKKQQIEHLKVCQQVKQKLQSTSLKPAYLLQNNITNQSLYLIFIDSLNQMKISFYLLRIVIVVYYCHDLILQYYEGFHLVQPQQLTVVLVISTVIISVLLIIKVIGILFSVLLIFIVLNHQCQSTNIINQHQMFKQNQQNILNIQSRQDILNNFILSIIKLCLLRQEGQPNNTQQYQKAQINDQSWISRHQVLHVNTQQVDQSNSFECLSRRQSDKIWHIIKSVSSSLSSQFSAKSKNSQHKHNEPPQKLFPQLTIKKVPSKINNNKHHLDILSQQIDHQNKLILISQMVQQMYGSYFRQHCRSLVDVSRIDQNRQKGITNYLKNKQLSQNQIQNSQESLQLNLLLHPLVRLNKIPKSFKRNQLVLIRTFYDQLSKTLKAQCRIINQSNLIKSFASFSSHQLLQLFSILSHHNQKTRQFQNQLIKMALFNNISLNPTNKDKKDNSNQYLNQQSKQNCIKSKACSNQRKLPSSRYESLLLINSQYLQQLVSSLEQPQQQNERNPHTPDHKSANVPNEALYAINKSFQFYHFFLQTIRYKLIEIRTRLNQDKEINKILGQLRQLMHYLQQSIGIKLFQLKSKKTHLLHRTPNTSKDKQNIQSINLDQSREINNSDDHIMVLSQKLIQTAPSRYLKITNRIDQEDKSYYDQYAQIVYQQYQKSDGVIQKLDSVVQKLCYKRNMQLNQQLQRYPELMLQSSSSGQEQNQPAFVIPSPSISKPQDAQSTSKTGDIFTKPQFSFKFNLQQEMSSLFGHKQSNQNSLIMIQQVKEYE